MTLSDTQQTLISELFSSIDAKDADRFVGYLTPDARFRFGSAAIVTGRDEIRAAVNGFFATIANLSHEVRTSLVSENSIICEGEVTYTRKDDSKITLPFVDVFEMADDLIANYKIYMDIAPLYAG